MYKEKLGNIWQHRLEIVCFVVDRWRDSSSTTTGSCLRSLDDLFFIQKKKHAPSDRIYQEYVFFQLINRYIFFCFLLKVVILRFEHMQILEWAHLGITLIISKVPQSFLNIFAHLKEANKSKEILSIFLLPLFIFCTTNVVDPLCLDL